MNIKDKETAGVVISTTELNIDEPGNATYTIVLTKLPTMPVTITATITDVDEDSTDDTISISSATNKELQLTFSTTNWDTPQVVTVKALDDADAEDETEVITHAITGGDPDYNPTTALTVDNVTINVEDDDIREVIISSTELSVTEYNKETYTIVLSTKPTGNVTVTVASDDDDALTVSPASLTFTSENWNTAQTVAITAVADDDAADEEVTITHAVTGTGGYDSVTADSVVLVLMITKPQE